MTHVFIVPRELLVFLINYESDDQIFYIYLCPVTVAHTGRQSVDTSWNA